MNWIYSWEANLSAPNLKDKVRWLTENGHTKKSLKQPKDIILKDRVNYILDLSISKKNFTVCMSKNLIDLQEILKVTAASWTLTTGNRHKMLHYSDLIDVILGKDDALDKQIVMDSELLILLYSDPMIPGISKFRGVFADIMTYRRAKNLPTITSIPVSERSQTKMEILTSLSILKQIIADQWKKLFDETCSKYLYFKEDDERGF